MSAAERHGYDRHVLMYRERAAKNTYAWWNEVVGPGYKYSTNISVWCRFSEFNHLSYHHIWCSPRMYELQSSWRRQDLKRAWRSILERIKLCDKPRLP